MYENPIQRDYIRTDNWSISATISRVDSDGQDEQNYDARIPNIAAGGALFLSDAPFEKGEAIWINMEVDPLSPGITRTIPMKVKGVIRGDRGMREGLHSYSVEFTVISNSDRIRLDELIQKTNYQGLMGLESDIFSR